MRTALPRTLLARRRLQRCFFRRVAATAAAATATVAAALPTDRQRCWLPGLSGRRLGHSFSPLGGNAWELQRSAAVGKGGSAQFASHAWTLPVTSFGERFQGLRQLPAGIRYWPSFVSPDEEAELIRVLDGEGSAWKRHIRRAQQFFGLVYHQTTQRVPELQPTGASPQDEQLGRPLEDLPPWFFARLQDAGVFASGPDGGGGPNQVAGNEYLEDSGIGLHVEDPGAGETLATISLLEPIQLTLQRAKDGRPQHRDERDHEDCLKLLLERRSLLVLEGESRHNFAHAIRQSRLVHLGDGGVLRRMSDYRRVSLTCRQLSLERRSAERQDMPDGYSPYQLPRLGPVRLEE